MLRMVRFLNGADCEILFFWISFTRGHAWVKGKLSLLVYRVLNLNNLFKTGFCREHVSFSLSNSTSEKVTRFLISWSGCRVLQSFLRACHFKVYCFFFYYVLPSISILKKGFRSTSLRQKKIKTKAQLIGQRMVCTCLHNIHNINSYLQHNLNLLEL